jgi:hypothetical protein
MRLQKKVKLKRESFMYLTIFSSHLTNPPIQTINNKKIPTKNDEAFCCMACPKRLLRALSATSSLDVYLQHENTLGGFIKQ